MVPAAPSLARGSKPYVYSELQWDSVYERAARFYARQTGVTLTLPPDIIAYHRGVQDYGVLLGGAYAATFGVNAADNRGTRAPSVKCVIVLRPGKATAGVIGHEVFHCLQLQLIGSDAAYEAEASSLGWVIEGGAAYAACRFTGEDRSDPEVQADIGAYRNWILTPGTPLLNRTGGEDGDAIGADGYSGIGFWGLLHQAGVNVFGVMPAVIAASSREQAYDDAVGGDESAVLDLWASSLYRDLHRSPAADWDVSGPCAPALNDTSSTQLLEHIIEKTLKRDSQFTLRALTYSASEYELQVNTDARIMHVQTESGVARVNGDGIDDVNVSDAYYCVASDRCSCPHDEQYVGPRFKDRLARVGPVPAIAVTGGPDGARVEVSEVGFRCVRAPKVQPVGVPRCPRITAPYQVCIVLEGSGSEALQDPQYEETKNARGSWKLEWLATRINAPDRRSPEFVASASSATGTYSDVFAETYEQSNDCVGPVSLITGPLDVPFYNADISYAPDTRHHSFQISLEIETPMGSPPLLDASCGMNPSGSFGVSDTIDWSLSPAEVLQLAQIGKVVAHWDSVPGGSSVSKTFAHSFSATDPTTGDHITLQEAETLTVIT